MAITIEQALVQLQAEMRGTREQVVAMATAHDELQEKVAQLEAIGSTSDQKMAEQVKSIEKLEDRLRQLPDCCIAYDGSNFFLTLANFGEL